MTDDKKKSKNIFSPYYRFPLYAKDWTKLSLELVKEVTEESFVLSTHKVCCSCCQKDYDITNTNACTWILHYHEQRKSIAYIFCNTKCREEWLTMASENKFILQIYESTALFAKQKSCG